MQRLTAPRFLSPLLQTIAITSLFVLGGLRLLSWGEEPVFPALLRAASVAVALLLLAAFLLLIFFIKPALLRRGSNGSSPTPFAVFFLIGILFLLFTLTPWGIRPLVAHFYGVPGVPVWEWQIAAALLISLLLAPLLRKRHALLLGFFALWGLTALLWASQPLQPNGYALAPQAPNYTIYPYSDPQNYDWYALNLLDGMRFNGVIPPRPLYIGFLALLHALVGLEYMPVILLQTILLAIFPGLVFLLGSRLGSPSAGLMAAILVLFRDLNTNQVADFARNISYSRLYLSELPVAILLVASLLFLLRWQRSGWRSLWAAAAAGACLGLATLIRTQSLILLPTALLFTGLAWRTSKPIAFRHWAFSAIWLVLATLLAIAPWLVRNHALTGGWVFDHPGTQTRVLAARYGGAHDPAELQRQAGETDAAYTSRLYGIALRGIAQNPKGIFNDVASHFVNNLYGSLRVFPLRLPPASPAEWLRPSQAFWEFPFDQTTLPQTGLWLALLLVFSAGVTALLAASGWMAFLLLGGLLAYNLWSALFLTSGERFLLPVDWTILIFLCAGVLALVRAVAGKLSPQTALPQPTRQTPSRASVALLALTLLLSLALGAALPLAEQLIPPRWPANDQARLSAQLETALDANPSIPAIALQPGQVILQGRILHPLWFEAGGGIPIVEDAGYRVDEQARLVFHLSGPESLLVVLPLHQSPEHFPNGAETLVIGEREGQLLRAAAVWLFTPSEQQLWIAEP